jgi:hypothetical protein
MSAALPPLSLYTFMSWTGNASFFIPFYKTTWLREALLKHKRRANDIHSDSLTKICNIFCMLTWFLYSTVRQSARLDVRLEIRTELALVCCLVGPIVGCSGGDKCIKRTDEMAIDAR